MLSSFQSEQGKVLEVIIKDASGSTIDPTLETITDIEVILVNRLDGSIIEKFSREEKEGFTQAQVTAEHYFCTISNLNATPGHVEAQINVITPNDDSTTGKSVHTQKGMILNISEAYNG